MTRCPGDATDPVEPSTGKSIPPLSTATAATADSPARAQLKQLESGGQREASQLMQSPDAGPQPEHEERRQRGRPRKLTDELQAGIVAAVEAGVPPLVA